MEKWEGLEVGVRVKSREGWDIGIELRLGKRRRVKAAEKGRVHAGKRGVGL